MNNSLNNQNLNKALIEDIKQLGNTENLLLSLEVTTTANSSEDTNTDKSLLTPAIQLFQDAGNNFKLSPTTHSAFKADFKASAAADVSLLVALDSDCSCTPLNQILGTPGRDLLNGTDGNDSLEGRQGRDTLIGGAGSDLFVYSSIVDGSDIINDFEVGQDKIVLTEVLDGFAYSGSDPIADGYISFASIASRPNDTIVKIDPDGMDGSGTAHSFIVAKDVSIAELNDLDNFIFSADMSTNEIVGTAARDLLNGTDGNDIIKGLQGRDTLIGGAGCDRFVYTSIVDGADIIEDFEVGHDLIDIADVLDGFAYSGSDPIADGYISFASIASRPNDTIVKIDPDGMDGSGTAHSFIVAKDVSIAELNDLDNFIFSSDMSSNEIVGTAARDLLNGTDGDDVIEGLQGRDTLIGGAGCDRFVYTSIVDGADIIEDFEVGHDLIDIADVLDGFAYSGSDPIADGYVSFGSIASRPNDTIIKIDPDGMDGSGTAHSFIVAKDVSIAEINDNSNFIF